MAANVTGSWASMVLSIGAAALMASPIVVAQTQASATEGAQLPPVEVEAEGRVVERTPIEGQPAGTTSQARSGGQMERVTVTRSVSLSDLDLSTPEGVKELHNRIEATARNECNQIKSLAGPLTTQAKGYEHVNDNCVKDAVSAARKQVDPMVASAEAKKHRG
jgi:UrcA family protein